MTVNDYLRKNVVLAQRYGVRSAVSSALNEATRKVLYRPYVAHKERQVKRRATHQQDLLDELWDQDEYTLLVFDTGRYDLLKYMLEDLYAGECIETYSAARSTFEWMGQTWHGDHPDVTYVSGMVPVTDNTNDIRSDDFRRRYGGNNPGDSIGEIVSVWKEHWDNALSTVTPETLVEQTQPYLDRDKLVVHFNQPHSPYVGIPKLLGHSNTHDAQPNQGAPNDRPIWLGVREGNISDQELRLAYIGNAVRGLQAAQPIVEARENVIITADHGEALGEYGMYTHDMAPHPKRRSVPWMRVDGVGTNGENDGDHQTVDEKLEALGYM